MRAGFFERTTVNMTDNSVNHDMSVILESVLRKRQTKLTLYPYELEIEIEYNAFDLLELFIESNYGTYNFDDIVLELSKKELLNKPDKDTLLLSRLKYNNVIGILNIQDVQELLTLMMAYQLIESDNNHFYHVTDKGKVVTNEAIIAKDVAKRPQQEVAQ